MLVTALSMGGLVFPVQAATLTVTSISDELNPGSVLFIGYGLGSSPAVRTREAACNDMLARSNWAAVYGVPLWM